MTLDFIERLIGLVERSRVTEIDYTEGGARVRIARGAPAGVLRPDQPIAGGAPATTVTVHHAPPATEHIVTAGMIGTFFRAPGPGQAPFVAEGDIVEEGRTLAILEAMKMLNPVEADRAGRIVRILMDDGASVEAGTPLFAMSAS